MTGGVGKQVGTDDKARRCYEFRHSRGGWDHAWTKGNLEKEALEYAWWICNLSAGLMGESGGRRMDRGLELGAEGKARL